jgi:hypothetical protein
MRRTVVGRRRKVERRHVLGANGGSSLRIVQVEGDPLEFRRSAHEHVDLVLNRQVVELLRVRPISAEAHREARPRGSRGCRRAQDADDPEYQSNTGAERDQPPPEAVGC